MDFTNAYSLSLICASAILIGGVLTHSSNNEPEVVAAQEEPRRPSVIDPYRPTHHFDTVRINTTLESAVDTAQSSVGEATETFPLTLENYSHALGEARSRIAHASEFDELAIEDESLATDVDSLVTSLEQRMQLADVVEDIAYVAEKLSAGEELNSSVKLHLRNLFEAYEAHIEEGHFLLQERVTYEGMFVRHQNSPKEIPLTIYGNIGPSPQQRYMGHEATVSCSNGGTSVFFWDFTLPTSEDESFEEFFQSEIYGSRCVPTDQLSLHLDSRDLETYHEARDALYALF